MQSPPTNTVFFQYICTATSLTAYKLHEGQEEKWQNTEENMKRTTTSQKAAHWDI